MYEHAHVKDTLVFILNTVESGFAVLGGRIRTFSNVSTSLCELTYQPQPHRTDLGGRELQTGKHALRTDLGSNPPDVPPSAGTEWSRVALCLVLRPGAGEAIPS